jgi:hypothetical protein
MTELPLTRLLVPEIERREGESFPEKKCGKGKKGNLSLKTRLKIPGCFQPPIQKTRVFGGRVSKNPGILKTRTRVED